MSMHIGDRGQRLHHVVWPEDADRRLFGRRALVWTTFPVRQVIRAVLERFGCVVDATGDGSDPSCEACATGRYDLVLVDFDPRAQDLAGTFAEIARTAGVRRSQLLGIGGRLGDGERAVQAGIAGNLPMPFAPATLVTSVEALLSAAADPEPATAVRPITFSEAAYADLVRHLDEGRVKSLLDLFRRQLAGSLIALASGNAEMVAAEAHALAGSSGVLGFEALHAAAANWQLGSKDPSRPSDGAAGTILAEVRVALALIDGQASPVSRTPCRPYPWTVPS